MKPKGKYKMMKGFYDDEDNSDLTRQLADDDHNAHRAIGD